MPPEILLCGAIQGSRRTSRSPSPRHRDSIASRGTLAVGGHLGIISNLSRRWCLDRMESVFLLVAESCGVAITDFRHYTCHVSIVSAEE